MAVYHPKGANADAGASTAFEVRGTDPNDLESVRAELVREQERLRKLWDAFKSQEDELSRLKSTSTLSSTSAAADGWATTRNLPSDVAQQVHSAIMASAVPEAVGLAKDIRLPPPIPLPQIQFQGQQAGAAAKPAAKDTYGSPEIG